MFGRRYFIILSSYDVTNFLSTMFSFESQLFPFNMPIGWIFLRNVFRIKELNHVPSINIFLQLNTWAIFSCMEAIINVLRSLHFQVIILRA